MKSKKDRTRNYFKQFKENNCFYKEMAHNK